MLALAAAPTHAQSRPAVDAVVIALDVRAAPQVRETAMTVTLTDSSGRPIPTDRARGRAEFSSGELRGGATLYPDGENRLKGYGLMSAKPDLTIAISVAIPGRPPAAATFMPLRKPARQP